MWPSFGFRFSSPGHPLLLARLINILAETVRAQRNQISPRRLRPF